MPAQALPATSSGASVGQSVEVFIDHCPIGMLRTMVAASSRRWFGRTSLVRPGMRCSVNRSLGASVDPSNAAAVWLRPENLAAQ